MIFTSDQLTTVQDFLVAKLYEACLLFVHPNPFRLEEATSQLEERYGWRRWLVSHELGAALLDVPVHDRESAARRWFRADVDARRLGPILVTDIALLFEPSFLLDPLRLMLEASRLTPLIVAWPGILEGDRLAYAVPEHSHYRTWPRSALCSHCVVSL